jgi:hypothetical protein
MAILTENQAALGKEALKDKGAAKSKSKGLDSPMGGDGSFKDTTIDVMSYIPDFLPEELASTAVCSSQAELDQITASLVAFKEVVSLTKKKYGLQLKAAALAYELTQSKNAMLSAMGKTLLKQRQSDADTAAALGAIPRMLMGIQGTIAPKTEKIVNNYTERLRKAADGAATAKRR